MDRETAILIWQEVPGLANVVTGRALEEFATRIERREREACIAAVMAERVDAEATQTDEDEAYNTALVHAADAIRMRSNVLK